jgi:hypothetical protein
MILATESMILATESVIHCTCQMMM